MSLEEIFYLMTGRKRPVILRCHSRREFSDGNRKKKQDNQNMWYALKRKMIGSYDLLKTEVKDSDGISHNETAVAEMYLIILSMKKKWYNLLNPMGKTKETSSTIRAKNPVHLQPVRKMADYRPSWHIMERKVLF